MEKISLAEYLKKAFEENYAFLISEDWSDANNPPELLSGEINMNVEEAINMLYKLESLTARELKKLLPKFNQDERKLYLRYMCEKNRRRFKPFPILASVSYEKAAKSTQPAVIFLFVISLLSIIFNWFLWLKIIFVFLFLWFLSSFLLTLSDSKRAKKIEKEQYY